MLLHLWGLFQDLDLIYLDMVGNDYKTCLIALFCSINFFIMWTHIKCTTCSTPNKNLIGHSESHPPTPWRDNVHFQLGIRIHFISPVSWTIFSLKWSFPNSSQWTGYSTLLANKYSKAYSDQSNQNIRRGRGLERKMNTHVILLQRTFRSNAQGMVVNAAGAQN